MLILPLEEIQARLKNLPGWQIEGNYLKKEYEFSTFTDSMIFVNEFAQAADDLGHYPASIDIRGNKVILSLISPDGFISDKDLLLAEAAQKAEEVVRET
jgi:4a-hydroxytetrahydrobiopterin dehydratase